MKTRKRAGRMKRRTHYVSVWRSPITMEWYWHITAANGNKVADCAEGYRNRKDCVNALLHLIGGILKNRVGIEGEGLD